jgi:invasion protein IalB
MAGKLSGCARPGVRALAPMLTTALLTFSVGSAAVAQTPQAQPRAKSQPKQQAQPTPEQSPAQAPRDGQQQAGAEQLRIVYSPWTKICPERKEANTQPICFTFKDGRTETGNLAIAATLIEPGGEAKKALRITLPVGMALLAGTRITVDQEHAMLAPYFVCFHDGCMADYEATSELIGALKRGQILQVQAVTSQGQPVSLVLPLGDFGKVNEAPPTDPKVFEEQQKKRQEDLPPSRMPGMGYQNVT